MQSQLEGKSHFTSDIDKYKIVSLYFYQRIT